MAQKLAQFGRNVTSEHGEDGILEHIFSVVGVGQNLERPRTTSERGRQANGAGWCVELGALNGKHGSNVWNLIKNNGWSGILIEADPTYFEVLQKEYTGCEVACINRFVSFQGADSLDRILAETKIPKQFDLLSLDIDGNDYHVWESLLLYTPRVAVVEFNPSIPNDIHFVQPRDMRVQQGSSLRAIVELGKKKGYELAAVTDTNAIFVLRELFPKFGIADNSIDALRTVNPYETKLFQLYDGTLKIAGYDKLIWHKVPIDEEALQVLSRFRRVYPAGTSTSGFVRHLKYWVRKMPFYALLQHMWKSMFRN